MRTFRYLTFHIFLFLFLTSSAYAETRYITDQLIVTVRSGKGNQYKILETLKTATPVEILESENNYVKVITPKGVEGYISSQYITKALPKSIQINQLNKEVRTLRQQQETERKSLQEIQNEANTQKQQNADFSLQLEQARAEAEKVSSDYQILLSKSDNILNLSTENDNLIEENNVLNSELLILREENQSFHRSNMIQWFLAGAGVLFAGWVIGKFSRKKQRRF